MSSPTTQPPSDDQPSFAPPASWSPVPVGPDPTPATATGYGAQPTGELVLELRKPFGGMGMITPTVTIDGYPVAVTWGRNAITAPAGERRVDVAQSYLWTYGRATRAVHVEPGRSTVLHYSGTMITFLSGRLGEGEQKRPGMAAFWVVISVPVLILLLVLLGAVVSALGS